MKITQTFKKRTLKHNYNFFDSDFSRALWGFLPLMSTLQKFGKKGQTLFYKIEKLRLILSKKISLGLCCFYTTTICTLNCSGCNTYQPEYTKDTHFKPISFEKFKHDLDNLLKAVDQIHIFQFFGGEPLLCKDLPEMIKYANSKKQLKHIFMTTNCTILPSEELIAALKKSRVIVQISDYRRQVKNVKIYYDEIKELFKKNNIRYCIWQEDKETWAQFPIIYQAPTVSSNPERDVANCYMSFSNPQFCDGKIFHCNTAVSIYRNHYNSNLEGHYIDINSPTLKDDLIDFYSKDHSEFCQYCSGPIRNKKITKGIQIKRESKVNE